MPLDRCRERAVVCAVAAWLGLASSLPGQEDVLPTREALPPPLEVQPRSHDHDSLLAKLNPFRHFDPSQPISVSELCWRLDCLTEELRDDGMILLKQPDVFSQARLTRFRNDFDTQMSTDLANFHLVLAARISRLDAATTTSTTALSGALSAPGTTHVTQPTTPTFMDTSKLFPAGGATVVDPTKGPLSSIGLANQGQGTSASSAAALGLGVDPTVYLDEKKRFLEHLNQIRRISLGPDQNDSSGYGLYLVRMPVSIFPGDRTYQGHGADLAVNVEHEFPPDFLPSTFQNLVVNDLVDEVGPFVYESIRSGFYKRYLERLHDAKLRQRALETQNDRLVENLLAALEVRILRAALARQQPGAKPDLTTSKMMQEKKKILTAFILRSSQPLSGDIVMDRPILDKIAMRLEALAEARHPDGGDLLQTASLIRRGLGFSHTLPAEVAGAVERVLAELTPKNNLVSFNRFGPLVKKLYSTALPDDVQLLDDFMEVPEQSRGNFTRVMAANNGELARIQLDKFTSLNKISLPSSRAGKQFYPIAPRELLDYLLEDNVYLMAKAALESSRTERIRLSEVRSYLRHTLTTAFYVMNSNTRRMSGQLPPLADENFMDHLFETIRQREFADRLDTGSKKKSNLEVLNDELIQRLSLGRDNVRDTPIGALCWAIAIDAAILDKSLRGDARKVLEAHGLPCDNVDAVRLYYPKGIPNEPARDLFCEYVRTRWPIITFSLDPVTDQQNIADTFNLKRDLQLAVSFAFATGQINFNQLNTFRRQIEQSSDTIALNRTVTGFSFSNDNFGFRFTPRFQNPPNQRTNIGVIASQLISGGPGPDYQVKKSKLESGMRELTAVLLIPEFLTTMRYNVSTNWFRLDDPEHLVFHTGRAMERGRRVQELRQAVLDACSARQYRPDDLRVLHKKLAQLDAMLPMQSKVVQLPFESAANGFDLLSDGSTALAPELTGFSGVDVIKAPPSSTTAAAAGALPPPAAAPAPLFPAPGTSGVQIVTTAGTAATTQTVSVSGGASSIADVFVFGKFLNLLDTRVIAGGRSAAFQLLSREVVHVQIPANVTPTKTGDGTYIEIYVATPNGISNSILVPYDPGTPPPAPVIAPAYDLAAASSNLTLFYQWLKGADGKVLLVATSDPGKKPIAISWDDATGLAPKRLQVQFTGTLKDQAFRFIVQAKEGAEGDYAIDPREFTRELLQTIQSQVGDSGAVPTSLPLTLAVQPYLPNDADNYRVRTEPKTLKTKLTVTLQYFAAGADALPAADAQSARRALPSGEALTRVASPPRRASPEKVDPGLLRTSQQLPSLPPLPPLPASLTAPQPPLAGPPPTLLAPNVTSEAEQVARMLAGQPQPPGQSQTAVATLTVPNTANQASPIVVMPAPVVVIPSKAEAQKRDNQRHHSRILKNLGDRINRVMPGSSGGD